eukprot:snap_masked-scaffold1843_size26594-processed-gene-0.5 protein:Tk04552 transcript:snap_masked-scaffold1843_size26594-processed-gene-0.5-mRNA-1 annotation:"PREDICTED: uncharacterized protein K02A2.6-like"
MTQGMHGPGLPLKIHEISLVDGLLVRDGHRVIVPPQAVSKILDLLHLSHSGTVKMLQNAKALYFWPGMRQQVANLVSSCNTCASLLPSQAYEPSLKLTPTGPMSDMATDLVKVTGTEETWLVLGDRWSGYPWVEKLSQLSSAAVISQLIRWFDDFGDPERLRSDGGPQFRLEFGTFCEEQGIVWEKSSPYNCVAMVVLKRQWQICSH